MKHASTAFAVVLILAVAAFMSVSGAGRLVEQSDLKIESTDQNPWTNLELNNREENFQFAIVTDRTGGLRPGIFEKAVEKLNLLQPEFVMSVGDLIQGGTEDRGQMALEWSEFQSMTESLEMPFFYCVGNHDISNVPMNSEWNRKFGRGYYHFVYRDVLFLILNSEDPPGRVRGKEQPYQFGDEQQEWARQVLNDNKAVRWTFIFFHKPVWDYPEIDPRVGGWLPIEDAMQDRQYTVFTGHKHNYAKFMRKGREYYMLATTGGGSELRGPEYGEFDHFVWVTMNDSGPVIANLMLDGIADSNIRTLVDPMPDAKTAPQ